MKIYNVRAKEGRRVELPGPGGALMVVPTQYEAQFPESAQLIRERDLHDDLALCELQVVNAEPQLKLDLHKKGK